MNSNSGDPQQCPATTWDRATQSTTQCAFPCGHEGRHDDGCLSWEDAPDEAEAGESAEVVAAIQRWRESIPDRLRAADAVFVDVDHTAAITEALSCLDDHTRPDSARMAGAREVLRRALTTQD